MNQTILPSTMFEKWFDGLSYGLSTTLTGMIIVFLVLVLIMCVIYLFRLFFYTIPNLTKKKKTVPEPEITEAPKEDPVIPVVLAAAVAAYMDEAAPASPYKIRAFKRII